LHIVVIDKHRKTGCTRTLHVDRNIIYGIVKGFASRPHRVIIVYIRVCTIGTNDKGRPRIPITCCQHIMDDDGIAGDILIITA
jgi:hypothetical protein